MTILKILAFVLGIIGILGCIVPVLPGPPVSYLGMMILFFWAAKGEITSSQMMAWLVVTLVVSVLDYLVPAIFTRMTGGSKAASRFSLVGMLLGIVFFPPLGMLVGAFLGALVGEYFYGKSGGAHLRPALGTFVGFLAGTGLKLIASIMMMIVIIKAL